MQLSIQKAEGGGSQFKAKLPTQKVPGCLGYMQSDTVSNPKGKVKEKKPIFQRKLALGFLTLVGLYFFWPYLVCVCVGGGVVLIRVNV